MSTGIKWLIGIVVIAAIAWAAWWSGLLDQYVPAGTQQANYTETEVADESLEQDTAAVDAELQALGAAAIQADGELYEQN